MCVVKYFRIILFDRWWLQSEFFRNVVFCAGSYVQIYFSLSLQSYSSQLIFAFGLIPAYFAMNFLTSPKSS